MIEVRQVSVSYGGTPVLKDISLEVRPGEIVALVGPNASGKSTLAMVLDGLILPVAGECLVDGVSTRDDPVRARLRVGLVFQDPDDQVVSRKVYDDIAFGPLNLGATDVDARVKQALKSAGISHLADRDIGTLSGGQKQLVAIAGVLAMQPAYLVLDEPTSLLDLDGARAVMNTIEAARKAGKGVLLITHDPTAAATADRVLLLKNGHLAPAHLISSGAAGVEPSELDRFWNRLAERGIAIARRDLTISGALEVLCHLKPRA